MLAANNVRRAYAELVGANVAPNRGALYTAYIHPDVSYDLRKETGAASWRDPWDDFAQDCIAESESLLAA